MPSIPTSVTTPCQNLPPPASLRAWAMALAGFAVLTLPAWAHAQAPDPASELEALLNTQVEGASRFLEYALDAPAATTAIGRDTSGALGHETVADMLERLPGIYISTSRNYSALGFRGFNRPGDYNARILMTIDGYRVNDALYDQALPGYEFPVIADWVKRLELISGPASSVYGGNALLGVANVVTIDGADAPGFGLKVGIERADTQRWTGQYGWHAGDSDFFVGLTHQQHAGETLHLPELSSDTLPGGVVSGLDGQRYTAMLAKLRRGAWRATLVAQGRDKDVATADYGTAPGVPGTRYADQYSYGELAYDGPWQNEWRLQARLNLARTSFEGHYQYKDDDGSRYVNRDDAQSRWVGADMRGQWRGWINHSVSAGAEVRRVLQGLQRNEDLDPVVVYLDRNDRLTQAGVYAQDQIRLSERSSLTLGLRADHAQHFGLKYSPRLALVHRPAPLESVKLMVGQAFRNPNLSERFYEDGGFTQEANPALRSERISSVELAWERAIGSNARLAVSVYSYRLNDLIDLVDTGDGVYRYENVSQARAHGIDLDVEGREPGGWQWRSSLSLSDLSTPGSAAVNSPRWLTKGHVVKPLGEDWSLGCQWLAMASREGVRQKVPSLLTVDAVIRRQLTPGHSLALVVRNLLDRDNHDPASSDNDLLRVPLPGRSVTLEWRGQF